MDFLAKLKNKFFRQSEKREVRFDDTGISIIDDDKLVSQIAWTKVLEVFAYKEDKFTFDEICLGFRIDADGKFWMISEDFIGYQALLDELQRRYEGIRTDWFSEVAFPAYVGNRTTLWGECWNSKN